jgi:hypothetical protein
MLEMEQLHSVMKCGHNLCPALTVTWLLHSWLL